MYIKLPLYQLCYMSPGLDDYDAGNPLLGPLEGVGPENLNYFGPIWHSLCSLPIQGPKKS